MCWFKGNNIFTVTTTLFLSFLIIYVSVQNCSAEDLPKPKLSKNVGGPTLKFLYCYSCGYRQTFNDYVNIIQQKYPYMGVDGENYTPSTFYMFLARAISLTKMLAIVLILGGVNVFHYIDLAEPQWWTWCTQNKLYACLMMFFVCNIFEGQLMSSGAFEIYLNDVPVWSKLETGRIPQPAELFNIIDSHMQFSDRTVEFNNRFA